MRLAGCMAALVLAGCYAPAAQSGAPCDLSLENCPSGQRCTMTGSGAFCLTTAPDPNLDGSTTTDGKPAPGCYGTGLVRDVCNLDVSADVDVTTDRVINTAMVGAPNCDSIIAQPMGGPSLCVVAANNFNVASGAKLSATGPNPLVLIAADTFTIAGTLDVASHINGDVVGPGSSMTCGNGINGGTGGGPEGAGGGGAGGSFGTTGRDGGVGFRSSTNNPGGSGGTALAPVSAPTALVGGCPGGNGGSAANGSGAGIGAGGRGGGALYVIAGVELVVSGTINASGAGGGPGRNSVTASAGGGGGGAGGFIGLDAPTLNIAGSVFANGGSGGGGGGDQVNTPGNSGRDPQNAMTPAAGGNGGTIGGGRGGDGFANAIAATKGANGNNPYCGAGGGGGGAGIIRVYGATPSGGVFSPLPN